MKKSFTFLILIIVAMSTYALPQIHINQTINSEKRLSISRYQKADKNTFSALAKQQINAAIANEEQSTTTLNFMGFTKFGYDSKYKDWYMEIHGNDPSTPEYGFRVIMAYYAPADNGFGTFTSEKGQINMADSYIYNPTKGYVEFESATLTTEYRKVSANLQQIIANATILGQDGVTYQITCTHNNITPKAQISGQIQNVQLIREEDTFTFAGRNQEFRATLKVNSDMLLGKFAMNKIDLQASEFIHNGNALEILSIQAEVVTKNISADLACVANVAFLTKDTMLYTLEMIHTLPIPHDSVDIVCTDLDVDGSLAEYIGVVNFEATNKSFVISGTWSGVSLEEGEYSDNEVAIDLLDKRNDQETYSLTATINATIDDSGRWKIIGSMRGDNNVVYNLDLSYVIPEPTDTIVIRYQQSARATFNTNMGNDLFFENEDEHYYTSINVRDIQMDTPFTINNVDKDYCGVRDSLTGFSTQLADINGRLFQTGDTTIMQAELISMDAVLYDIELWYVAPTPIDTVTLSFPVEFGDLRSEQGFYQLYGPTPDTSYVVAFSPLSEKIEGTFVNDGMFGKLGAEGGRYEMAGNYTYVAIIENGMLVDLMPIEKGQLDVTMDSEGNITAVAEVVCHDKVLYHFTMTSKYEKEYLRGDVQSGSVDRTYTAADEILVEDYSKDGYVYLAILAEDMSDLVAMHFFIEATDPDILIPEGTYDINKSYRPGTVLANMGLTNDNELQTPFYGTLNAKGEFVKVYMWVDGSVVVSKNEDGKLRLEVNAVNSYDVPIHITYDASMTDVENIDIENPTTYKRIIDGQLIIIRNGVMYNVQGTVIP